ncbi:4642_t:CDS:1, partial [Gigaspora rosea]
SVVGRGINFGGGHGIEAAQSLNTIFIELEKLSRYFKLYLGGLKRLLKTLYTT